MMKINDTSYDYLFEDGFIFPRIDKRIGIYKKGIDPYGIYNGPPKETFEAQMLFVTVVRIEMGGKWYDVIVKEHYTKSKDSLDFVNEVAECMQYFIEKVYSTMLLYDPEYNAPSENQMPETERISKMLRFEL